MANFHAPMILILINSSPTQPPSSKMTLQSSQARPQIEYVYIGHILLKQLSNTGQGVKIYSSTQGTSNAVIQGVTRGMDQTSGECSLC